MWKARLPSVMAAAIIALAVSDASDAATITYQLSGRFDGIIQTGGTSRYFEPTQAIFIGVGDTDDIVTGIGYTAVTLSAFTATIDGTTYTAQDSFEFFNYPGALVAGFGATGNQFAFTAAAFASYDPRTAIGPIAVTDISGGRFSFLTDRGTLNIGTSFGQSLSASVNAAVPEPSTWMMMVVGFALTGAALRTRRTPPERALRIN